ncbi:MAG: putative deoxygenase [Cyanobacteria bacterium RYN_339]|nr:putative deoxygenase [Cyanobacteria bacterium RYN_339]
MYEAGRGKLRPADSITHRKRLSYAAFLKERVKYALDCKPERSPSLRQSADFQTLCRDGIVMIPGFLAPEQVEAYVRQIKADTPIFDGQVEVSDIGSCILNDADQVGDFQAFFESPLIQAMARAYVSADVETPRKQIMLKLKPGEEAYSDFYHIDHWEHKLRAFLLLQDVSADNAPLVYLKGSHRLKPWRLRKEFEIFHHFRPAPKDVRYATPHTTEESKWSGMCLAPEVYNIGRAHGYEEYIATGTAGSLLLFDAKGLHHSTALKQGTRLLLAMHLDRRSKGYFKRVMDYEGQG